MRKGRRVSVIIPALNEASSIARVIHAIPDWVDEVVVVDNGSKDATAAQARAAGAEVLTEPRRGYGQACLSGLARVGETDVVVFLDADYDDDPQEMHKLVDPIPESEADLVIGSRVLGKRERGALTLQARAGNQLACFLIRLLWGSRYTDLGPFRAVRFRCLERLRMADRNYGWTVEMQVKAIQQGLRVREVPVRYRRRIGRSKISGTLRGVVGAGSKILWTIFSLRLKQQPASTRPPRLILFTRYPTAGKTKTRLIPLLGAAGAARLQRRMTEHVASWARELQRAREVDVEIAYDGGGRRAMERWLGAGLGYARQGDGDLGRRLARAFDLAFRDGAGKAVIIGGDAPALGPATVRRALGLLDDHDLVLGPAADGGYYLIGMKAPCPGLFKQIPWGSEEVLPRTLSRASGAGLSTALLPQLADVDRPEDLPVWEAVRRAAARRPLLSVIIPALDEASYLPAALSSVVAGGDTGRVEIIVADGGSRDGTAALAERFGARVVRAPRGRAAQMNAGARLSRGRLLLFLHADTCLPPGYLREILRLLHRADVAAGAFRLRIASSAMGLRVIEWLCNVRSALRQRPYGDHGLFLSRDLFARVGGFPQIPLMEDLAMIKRVRRYGRIVLSPLFVTTSARRFEALGVWRTTLISQLCIWAYALGVSPVRIARWYYGKKRPGPRGVIGR